MNTTSGSFGSEAEACSSGLKSLTLYNKAPFF